MWRTKFVRIYVNLVFFKDHLLQIMDRRKDLIGSSKGRILRGRIAFGEKSLKRKAAVFSLVFWGYFF